MQQKTIANISHGNATFMISTLSGYRQAHERAISRAWETFFAKNIIHMVFAN